MIFEHLGFFLHLFQRLGYSSKLNSVINNSPRRSPLVSPGKDISPDNIPDIRQRAASDEEVLTLSKKTTHTPEILRNESCSSYTKNRDDINSARLRLLANHHADESGSPSQSTFRRRRLTMSDSKPESPMNPMDLPKRASIFSSGEIGVISEKCPPFPQEILGTFSCHGIEPEYSAEDEEIGVIQKINQDRGCVVYPFNKSRAQALFMVMDGHGAEGNRVSEYVMRQVFQACNS